MHSVFASVVDNDMGRYLTNGLLEIGELVMRENNIMKGFHNYPDATEYRI